MERGRVVTAITRPGRRRRGRAGQQTAETRERVRLMIEITARDGEYRKGLLAAAGNLSPEEAVILADLEGHGIQVPQLRDVLCGGHVIIDDPDLYEHWRFARVSHNRLSSHHRNIDKALYPDIGMRGLVVREKLHGRTAQGTWVQLEKTPAAFGGKKKLPSLDDLRHLMDYVTYRITRSNVGPWGLSKATERRPIYLSPQVAVPVPLSPPVAASLDSALHQIEASDDVTAASSLAFRFAPPERADPSRELGQALPGRAGRGLFGNSEVWVTQSMSPVATALLRAQPAPPPWGPQGVPGAPQAGGGHRD
jgi:hypothetical protein